MWHFVKCLHEIAIYHVDTTPIVYCLGPCFKYIKQLLNCGSTLGKTTLFVSEQVIIIHVLTDGVSDYCLPYVPYYAGQTDWSVVLSWLFVSLLVYCRYALFQSVGGVPVVSDVLNVMRSGILIVSAKSLRTRG